MSFQETFGAYVCVGDSISCEAQGYNVSARICFDDTAGKPDENQDGFWPSLIKTDAGFIGADKNLTDFMTAQAKAQAIMDAWKNDEWFYCGVILSVNIQGVELTDHGASLWGLEANFPNTENEYLTEVACSLLDEALLAAKVERSRRLKILQGQGA